MTTFDDNTNPDLPGEIHDETFPCGFYPARWWDWNDDIARGIVSEFTT